MSPWPLTCCLPCSLLNGQHLLVPGAASSPWACPSGWCRRPASRSTRSSDGRRRTGTRAGILDEICKSKVIGITKGSFKPANNRTYRAVVVVKWSACSPLTPTIRVRIMLKPTVLVFEKDENKHKKRPGLAHFLWKNPEFIHYKLIFV